MLLEQQEKKRLGIEQGEQDPTRLHQYWVGLVQTKQWQRDLRTKADQAPSNSEPTSS